MFKDPYTKFFMNSAPPAPPTKRRNTLHTSKRSAIKYAELLTSDELLEMQKEISGPLTGNKDKEKQSDLGKEALNKIRKSNFGPTY